MIKKCNLHMNRISCPLHPIHVLTYLSWSEEERSSRKELCLHVLAQFHKQRLLKVAKHPAHMHRHG